MRALSPLCVCALLLLGGACGVGGSEAGSGEGRVSVVASVYPLEFVLERVGGDAIQVEGLTATGVEPHDLELSSSQIVDLVEADLVVYVGGGFQPALEDALQDVESARQLDVLAGRDLIQGAEGHGHEEDEAHAEGEEDPHVWLDPSLLAAITEEVGTRLAELDPTRAATYETNAEALSEELIGLDGDFETGLAHCKSREFVTSHAAFGYLASRYGLEQVSVSGIDPEAEPSPQRLAEVARFVDEHDVRVIFFEELAPADLAETLARETGATTDVLATLETAPEEGDYVDAMRSNLERLRGALGCE
jgi:zinc transport system substrate-binding protein